MDDEGYIKLIDFGCSILLKDNKRTNSFIGTPAMNFFEGKVKSNSKSFTTITLKDQKEIKLSSKIYEKDQDIIFGIRPEDINVIHHIHILIEELVERLGSPPSTPASLEEELMEWVSKLKET